MGARGRVGGQRPNRKDGSFWCERAWETLEPWQMSQSSAAQAGGGAAGSRYAVLHTSSTAPSRPAFHTGRCSATAFAAAKLKRCEVMWGSTAGAASGSPPAAGSSAPCAAREAGIVGRFGTRQQQGGRCCNSRIHTLRRVRRRRHKTASGSASPWPPRPPTCSTTACEAWR